MTARPSAPIASDQWQGDWEARCQSPAEVAFLRAAIKHFALRPIGDVLGGEIILRLQHKVGPIHVDFLVNNELVVEIDGHAYHSSRDASVRDGRRDGHLRTAGYRVQRIPAYKVFNNPDAAIADVRERIEFADEIDE